MSISIYDQFVPVFSHLLSALDKVLSKAEADAAARKIDLDVFVNGRLAPDMPEQFEGCETRAIEIKFPNATFNFNGKDYLLGFAIPNFYFHYTTAYAILRHNGVPIGKGDFLGNR